MGTKAQGNERQWYLGKIANNLEYLEGGRHRIMVIRFKRGNQGPLSTRGISVRNTKSISTG